ncbi:hypothetical protein ACQCN2_12655 [Brevibacillus ginsengisoli]|uniref:hypothetical protein n=1 Tax=Brevibacillus ginsengisoli TaxID=363854 RepID=UPI003CE770C3
MLQTTGCDAAVVFFYYIWKVELLYGGKVIQLILSRSPLKKRFRPLVSHFKRNQAQRTKEGKESAFFTSVRIEVIFLSTPFRRERGGQ